MVSLALKQLFSLSILNKSSRSGYWSLTCSIQSAKRRLNKLVGRPSTPFVGTLASLIQPLLTAAQSKHPSLTLTRALITVPETPGLTDADFSDAMDYLGLTLLITNKHVASAPPELSAAYAGSGHGLCMHYPVIDTCEDEEADMPTAHILALSLTHHTFSASYTYTRTAYRSVLESSATRFDLGLDHLPSSNPFPYPNPPPTDALNPDAHYWAQIAHTIVEIGRTALRPLATVLLLGEDASNADFIRTAQEALRELLPEASAEEVAAMVRVPTDGEGPLYLAAKGAAEFGKRRLEAPAGCVEPKRCAVNREPVGGRGLVCGLTESKGMGLGGNQMPLSGKRCE